MGSWAVITCVRAHTGAAVAALERVFAHDRYRAGHPMLDEPPREWNYTSFRFTDAEAWHVQIWQGQAWSQIHCTPIYLMSGRAAGSTRPRLADLAGALSADAFALNVFDSTDAVLVECAADGRFAVTGSTCNLLDDIYERYPDLDPPGGVESMTFPYFDETLSGRDPQPQFRLIRDLHRFNNALAGDAEFAVDYLSRELSGEDESSLKQDTRADADLWFHRKG